VAERRSGARRDSRESAAPIELFVLGGRGYVAAELLRFLAGHPRFRVAGATGRAEVGASLDAVFPTLAGAHPGARILASDALRDAIAAGEGPVAIVSCLPHGVAAPEIRAALAAAESAGRGALVVDTSSDFRFSPEEHARIHGASHSDPELAARFVSALPDVPGEIPAGLVAHPGCFTTSVTLPLWPLAAAGVLRRARVSAITGSSGSGREPSAATHHPERHGNLWAYKALVHPHQAEMRALLTRAAPVRTGTGSASRTGTVSSSRTGTGSGGTPPVPVPSPAIPASREDDDRPRSSATATNTERRELPIDFVPHSGPFVRGIHATIFAELAEPLPADEVAARIAAFYAHTPFVAVGLAPPRLAHVAGTNRIAIGVAGSGSEVVITSVIDNLGKGAAGGALQWLNRLAGLEETMGLMAPALGVS